MIDVNAGGFRLKKGQGILHPTLCKSEKDNNNKRAKLFQHISTLSHLSRLLLRFSLFSRTFPQDVFLQLRGFSSKRLKENKKKKTEPCCMLVVGTTCCTFVLLREQKAKPSFSENMVLLCMHLLRIACLSQRSLGSRCHPELRKTRLQFFGGLFSSVDLFLQQFTLFFWGVLFFLLFLFLFLKLFSDFLFRVLFHAAWLASLLQDLLLLAEPQVQIRLFAFKLVSRGRCGREIARLRRLAAVVAAIFLRF